MEKRNLENNNELINKENVLSEISFAMIDDIPDLQTLYQKIESINYDDNLNEIEQIAFNVLRDEYLDRENIQAAIYWVLEDDTLPPLNEESITKVLQSFLEWRKEWKEDSEK